VYTHFSAKLIKDFENSTLYHPDRFKLNEIKESNIILKDELTRLQSQSSESSARKDQTIETLTSEKSVLEFKNSSLLTALELLQTELLKITRSLNNAHQENVRLCMQSYQYKAEVDRSSEIIAECVKSRVGFVPRRVLLQIRRIKSMKVRSRYECFCSFSPIVFIVTLFRPLEAINREKSQIKKPSTNLSRALATKSLKQKRIQQLLTRKRF
jgi:hypothetical protein